MGLGANLGDPRATLARALELLDDPPDVAVEARSSLYETEPVGPVEQPAFLNAAAQLRTSLEPLALLRRLLQIETELGRVRTIRFGPRTCDLDLLLYQGVSLDSPELTLPHPRLAERRFALEPLLELDPTLALPDGRRLSELAAGLVGQPVQRLVS